MLVWGSLRSFEIGAGGSCGELGMSGCIGGGVWGCCEVGVWGWCGGDPPCGVSESGLDWGEGSGWGWCGDDPCVDGSSSGVPGRYRLLLGYCSGGEPGRFSGRFVGLGCCSGGARVRGWCGVDSGGCSVGIT